MGTLLSQFQSTLSSRRATYGILGDTDTATISIHALLTESDEGVGIFGPAHEYFNPRSPHGERRRCFLDVSIVMKFQSTLSSRRATARGFEALPEDVFQSTLSSRRATPGQVLTKTSTGISIHALLTESDSCNFSYRHDPENFNPRSPHGERRAKVVRGTTYSDFNPRSPHGERRTSQPPHRPSK